MNVDEFRQMPLRAHRFLAGVPVHSLDYIDLPGGREHMTLQEISEVVGFDGETEMEAEAGPLTRALFWLRGLIGRLLRWDEANELVESVSYISRLTEEDRARTRIEPGQKAGISRILYQFDDEMLGEIINRTVHCFWVMASEPRAHGYGLWVAVYVKKLNWFTPIYMAMISPLLKWVIYPAMWKAMVRRWERAFPAVGEPRVVV